MKMMQLVEMVGATNFAYIQKGNKISLEMVLQG